MSNWLRPVVLKLLCLMLLLTVYRVAFYMINKEYFSSLSQQTIFKAFVFGWRFDLVCVLYVNIAWLVLELLFEQRKNIFFQVYFVISNLIVLGATTIDWYYYKYVNKRLSVDFFTSLFDIQKHVLSDLVYYFWGIIVLVLSGLLLHVLYKNLNYSAEKIELKTRIVLGLLLVPLLLIGLRGGTQLRPITPGNANDNISAEAANLVHNSFFNMAASVFLPGLPDAAFYDDIALKKKFNTTRQYKSNNPKYKNKNVVLILVESLSKEYLHTYNLKYNYTPFLDSMLQISRSYPNFYANSKQSIKGNIAVLSSIPSLMDMPITTSKYQSNQLFGLPHYLKKIGYQTCYYHGAHNGSFNLETLAYKCGFDSYYGMDQYANSAVDYDGEWGIWDVPFLQNMIASLDTMKPPFFATVFTLSNHHPYSLPSAYQSPQSTAAPYLQTLTYTDFALRQFFEKAKSKQWFDETIFILTGDHTGPFVGDDGDNTQQKNYQLPLLIYTPKSPVGSIDSSLCQQIDIMPTVLKEVGFEEKFHSYGYSIDDTSQLKICYTYLPPFFIISENQCVVTDIYKDDTYLDTSGKQVSNDVIQYFKAILQTYTIELKTNQLTVEDE